jgi:23S rRNA A2030 N6-methylase RlmJ
METGEIEDTKVREKDTLSKKFWIPIFEETNFKEFVKTYYSIGHKPLLDIDLDLEIEDV